jgi:beta-glucosidase
MDYEELIKAMTLEEKASLLSGGGNFTTKTVKRLGIPSIYLSDGPHGLRKQAGAGDHLGLSGSVPATCFPTAAAMANSWDTSLGEELGAHLGTEARALGVNVLLGPGLNMKRSPLCGRSFEYFSEDPYLAGKMAAAYIRGIQSKGIAACPKHFAANNQEFLRMHNDSVVDERTLREVYLTGFEIAVKEGKPLAIMTAYNKINGEYANENKHLLQDILADEWGFTGLVVSDWGGCNDRVAGLEAGNHLEMPATAGNSDREVVSAVKSGRISESLLDNRVKDYLRFLFAVGIPENTAEFDTEAHHVFARKTAESAIVLLKNKDSILPLKVGTKVAVIGDFADKPRYQGFGSSMVNPTRLDSPLNCLISSGLNIIGYTPGFRRHGGEDAAMRQAAVFLVEKSDVALLYLGLDESGECEGMDRAHMRLNQNQADLLEAVSKVNPHVVVILAGGAPVETPWIDTCEALIHGYLGGQAGAGAMTDALTGKINPSGKLAETWPLVYEDTPANNYFPGLEKTTEYREGVFIGYRYFDTAAIPVRFPFGFGMSYTTFAYTGLEINEKEVSFTVTNSGIRAGAEIAQIYISSVSNKLFCPAKELKGFTKVSLLPGEQKSVTVLLDDKAFRYFNIVTGNFEIEGGIYTIQVGASSTDIRLSTSISITGTNAPIPYNPTKLPSYYSGNVSSVSDTEFEYLLGHPIPESKWDRTQPLSINDTFFQLSYAKSLLGRIVFLILTGAKNRAERKGKPDLNLLFIYNIPFRGIAKMMGGVVDLEMAGEILSIFNGYFFKGLSHLIGAWFRKNNATKDTSQKLAKSNTSDHTKEISNGFFK